jgi:hypothetical protein
VRINEERHTTWIVGTYSGGSRGTERTGAVCVVDGRMEGGGEVANQRAKALSRLRVAKVGSFYPIPIREPRRELRRGFAPWPQEG